MFIYDNTGKLFIKKIRALLSFFIIKKDILIIRKFYQINIS